jgi:hypothetical protein
MTGFRTVRPRHFIATLIVGLLALTWLDVQSATAAPRWSKPVTVSKTNCRNGPATKLQAAQNARGDALVAWTEECAGSYGRWRVVAVSRKAGHRFGRPRIIHSGGRAQSMQLGIALDATGGGTIAWTRTPAYNTVPHPDTALLVATRRPGERFSRPRLIDEHGGWFDLAANPAGETVLTWVHFVPPNSYERPGTVVAAIRPAGVADFGPPRTLSGPSAPVSGIALAIAPDGTALASWTHREGSEADCCTAVEAAIRLPGEHFGALNVISPPAAELNQAPAVAVGHRGSGAIAWTTSQIYRWPPLTPKRLGVYASRWDGQAFSVPVTLDSALDVFWVPNVMLARDGKATVEWYRGYPRSSSICGLASRYALTLPATGPPGTPAMISPPNGLQSAFASALDIGDRPIRVWFQGTAVTYEKYNNCAITASRVGAAIDNGPTIHGPAASGGPVDMTLIAAPAATPALVWPVRRRVVMSTLRDAP